MNPILNRALMATTLFTVSLVAQVPTNVAGEGKVALGGYDPVAFFTANKPVAGSPSITAVHAGATYFLASEEDKKLFEQHPDRYLPQYGGYCAFGVSLNALLPVDITTWLVQDGKLYLNLNPDIAKLFNKDRKAVLAKADLNWAAMQAKPPVVVAPRLVNVAGAGNVAIGGYDPVAFFTAKAAVAGSPSFAATHAGATYFFANEQDKKLFEQAPDRYLPQFGGYCAFGVSLGALLPVDIRTWLVQDGKLYLNLNPDIAKLFNKDRAAVLSKAETNWLAMQQKSGN